MNDKKKHLRRCPRIAAHEYIRIFTTTTSDEQYFLNEKAVYCLQKNVFCSNESKKKLLSL